MTKILAILLFTSAWLLPAQWLHYPDARSPRSKDGKPNLAGPTPRMDGKPDLSGVWQAQPTPLEEYVRVLGKDMSNLQVDLNDATKEAVDVFWGVKPADQPIRPEAVAILKQRRPAEAPGARCLPTSIPASIFLFAFKMIQTPKEVVVMYEDGDPTRQVYLDGRSLPADAQASWMGYSVGKWEGNTLVVETIGIHDQAWLDIFGHPRSEAMRITERYRRRDFGHMDVEVMLDDPKYYTRPIQIKTQLNLIPDSDILEAVCAENEKDLSHMATQ